METLSNQLKVILNVKSNEGNSEQTQQTFACLDLQ